MRYGKKPTGGMWVMSFQLRRPPLCPGCTEELQGIVVEIRNGWAWCPICIAYKLHRSTPVRYALAMDCFRERSTLQHGLRFYTPDATAGKPLTAYEWCEKEKCDCDLDVVPPRPEGVYALTPSGEHLLSDLDTNELQALEQTLKAVRDGSLKL